MIYLKKIIKKFNKYIKDKKKNYWKMLLKVSFQKMLEVIKKTCLLNSKKKLFH